MGESTKNNQSQDIETVADEQLTLDALGAEVSENSEVAPEKDIDQIKDSDTDTPQEPVEESAIELADTTQKTAAKVLKKSSPAMQKKWQRNLGFAIGVFTLVTLMLGGALGQYYKQRPMPGVSVAGAQSGALRSADVQLRLENQYRQLSITIVAGEKELKPELEEIGFSVDVEKTVENSLRAKRDAGLFTRLAFWKEYHVPAVVVINDTILNQYLETHTPELTVPAQDAHLQFDPATSTFIITNQADGSGPDVEQLKQRLSALGDSLQSSSLPVQKTVTKPKITQAKLQSLIEPANNLVARSIILTGLGYTYRATPADIATWVTPTPQSDGAIKLVVDPAKVQSYVEEIGKKVASPPQDQKVLKDEATGAEVILQAGRHGTELSDRSVLANAIAEALKEQRDLTQTMNIQTAAFKTVNMNAYDRWIEVDLSEQRTTAYEKATPVKHFTIASGMRGHETVTGEFAIWLKNRKQTMTGGSKADGSYYSIPNVEWVSYFYQDYALHGAWWREKFGAPASHGCVNMTNADAQWIYEWAPVGTKVIVHQ